MRDSYLLVEKIKAAFSEWARRSLSPTYGFDLRDYAVVGDHIWILGKPGAAYGPAYIVHSQDAGGTWELLWEDKRVRPERPCLYFSSATDGFVTFGGQSTILRIL